MARVHKELLCKTQNIARYASVVRLTLCLVVVLALAHPLATTASVRARMMGYRVVAVTASARLTYSSGGATNSRVSGFAEAKSTLRTGRDERSHGSLGARGGKIRFPVAVAIREGATVGERPGPSSPYVEQTCRNRSRRNTRGGLTLRSLPGSKVQVTWGLPHAVMSRCPGPTSVSAKLQQKMFRVYSKRRFTAGRLVLVLAGTAKFRDGSASGSYRWRATISLVSAS